MLTSLKNNRSLTFFQQNTNVFKVNLSQSYTGGFSSVAIANVSIVTNTQTSNINASLANLRVGLIQRGSCYASNPVASRGGYMAETWHALTYNLDATIKKVNTHARVLAQNGIASPDIEYNNGKQASLKYCSDAKASAMSQTNPNYGDQNRIVPTDQRSDSEKILQTRIDRNIKKGRVDTAEIQKQAKSLLDDRIRGDGGVESTPLTKEQDMEIAKAIKPNDKKNIKVDIDRIDKIIKDTGVKRNVNKAIFKNELRGLGVAVAIAAGVGLAIGFVATLAQSGITPETIKLALIEGGKSGTEAGIMSAVSYGVGRTIGEMATKALTGVLGNLGMTITDNISKMCSMGVIGTMTITLFSAYQFIKLKQQGVDTHDAVIRVGKQALFSLSLLAVSIAAQGIWGGPAGIIVSLSVGIIMISYTTISTVHQRRFADYIRVYTIDRCRPLFTE